MANRYTNTGITQVVDNNYRLNYEQLAAPIVARDAEYKAIEEGFNQYTSDYIGVETLPQDYNALASRLDNIIQDEKQFRDRVGGDLTSPQYQDLIRERLKKEALDPSVKNYMHTLEQKKLYEAGVQEHKTKTGELPRDWQSPEASYWNTFDGTDISGTAPRYSGITPRLDFSKQATEFLKESVTKKLSNSDYRIDDTSVPGEKFIIHKDGSRVTAAELLEIMGENKTLMGGTAHNQMKMEYDEAIRKGELDQALYPTFDDYFAEEMSSIAKNLAYSWSEEEVAKIIPKDNVKAASGAHRALRTAKAEEVMPPPSADITVGASAVGLPSISEANRYAANATHRNKRITEVTQSQLEEHFSSIDGVGNVRMVQRGGAGGQARPPGWIVDYVDDEGNTQSLDLTDTRKALPLIFQEGNPLGSNSGAAISIALEASNSYFNNTLDLNQLEDFDNGAGSTAFGVEQWKQIKSEG